MQTTVPTLCATGSILGAASIGLSFGQQTSSTDQIPPVTPGSSSNGTHAFDERRVRRRHGLRLSRGSISDRFSSLASSRSSTPLTNGPHAARPPPSPLGHVKDHQDLQDVQVGRDSISSPRLPLSQSMKPGLSPASLPTASPDTLRRRPSRLRQRLSSWSVSLGTASSPSERPYSSSLAGSGDPFFPVTEETSRLPNKLVKRSLSHHVLEGSGQVGEIATQTLERPATRHKRLATLSTSSWSQDASSHSSSHDKAISGNHLPSYFTSSVPGPIGSSTGRRGVSSKEHPFIRRILPRPFASPTLCRGDTVRPASVGVDPVLDTGDEHFQFGSRPSTPSGQPQFFSSPEPELGTTKGDRSLVPRRSSSVNKLLTSANLKHRSRTLKLKLGSRRVTSAPSTTMTSNIEETASQPQPKRQRVETKAEDHLSESLHHSNIPDPYAHADGNDDAPPPLEAHNSSPSMPPTSLRTPPSNTSFTSISKRSRHSAAFSDVNSSQPGSESDGKVFSSADEDETRSDTAYDSVRTGMTKSSSNYQRPTLETLFDKESPPPHHHDSDTALHYFGKGSSTSPITTKGHTIAEEDSSTSTPGRTIVPERRGSQDREPGANNPSSSPAAPKELSLGRLSWGSADSKKSVQWPESIEEEDWDNDPLQETPADQRAGNVEDPLASVRRKLNFLNVREDADDSDPRATIFDWSEPANIDRGMTDSPPPRPKTVHGRKNPDASGGKAATRRAPSGLHARSHSVPVLADLVGQRSTVSKFGTWGIGSKGVTEDWNDDFDFDVEEPPTKAGAQALDEKSSKQAPAPTTMVIPATIRASQTNVLANVGLLKEWGILIEELKDLRSKAVSLSIEQEPHATIFDEVDAMIDLADQEHDDSGFPSRQTPTSSPGFDVDDSSPSTSALASTARNSQALDSDVEAESGLSTPIRTSFASETPRRSEAPTTRTRPRKDSEAVAQTVIEALQQRRHPKYLSTPDQPHAKKIPFDTRTLRKIVPHVSNLVKSVKQIIRVAENLHSSPKASRHLTEDAFRDAFVPPESGHQSNQQQADDAKTWLDEAADKGPEDLEYSYRRGTSEHDSAF